MVIVTGSSRVSPAGPRYTASRGNTSLADRVEWDNYYIENWSLWLDMKIAVMTVGSLLRWRED